MRRVSTRLAVLGAASVIVSMALAAFAFDSFMGARVEAEATAAIEYTLAWEVGAGSWGDEDADAADTIDGSWEYQGEGYDAYASYASYLELDASYHALPDGPWAPSAQERDIARWFSVHPEQGVVSRISADGWTCYAAMADAADLVYSDDAVYAVAYYDVTDELDFIALVRVALVFIASVCAVVAALAGRAAGLRVEQAQAAQKRLYENMSHELKTPLAAIRGYAEGASAGVVDEAVALVGIDREADRMAAMVGDILDLSRLESGAVELKLEEVEVPDFVQDCLMPLEGAVRSRGLSVSLDLARGSVRADPTLFDHALSNMLTNAVRHASTWMRVSYDGLRLSVSNDGTAPSEGDISHLFERFRIGEGGSTGIGLAIVAEIATLHGWGHGADLTDGNLVVWLDMR